MTLPRSLVFGLGLWVLFTGTFALGPMIDQIVEMGIPWYTRFIPLAYTGVTFFLGLFLMANAVLPKVFTSRRTQTSVAKPPQQPQEVQSGR